MSKNFQTVVGHQLAKDVFERYMKKRMPHSFIFVGPKGVGKRIFAEELAGLLLCESHSMCGICVGCLEWKKNERQGYFLFPRGKLITIDQIRKIREELTKSDWRGIARVVLIEDAESITVPAANAILKILEEPGSRIYYIFVAENLKRVLDTIVSRSVILPFNRLSNQEIEVILQQKGLADEGLKKIVMGLPARIDKVSLVSIEQHIKNVKNFWMLTQTNSAQKMMFVDKIAKSDKKRLLGLIFFWESCLRDYLLWQLKQDNMRWWQSEEIDELYAKMNQINVEIKLKELSVIKDRLDVISKKIQLFNWLISF